MNSGSGLSIAVVGMGFGMDFVPIYLSHPQVRSVALCDPNTVQLEEAGRRYGVDRLYTSLDELLACDDLDAVHLVTPVALHARQAVDVLLSGRHCASAVPMGLTVDEVEAVVDAARRSGRNFMMMETAVYQREFRYASGLYHSGRMGKITFLRGAHIRDRTEMPRYWQGFPPLKYATHAVSPILALVGKRVEYVHGFGSGTLSSEHRGSYDNPFPLETAILSLADSDLRAEVTQGCFQVARPAQEGFSAYGEKMSVEWPQLGDEGLQVYTMHDEPAKPGSRFRRVDTVRVDSEVDDDVLPPEIARFRAPTEFVPGPGSDPIIVTADHSGSHPYLVHEFVTSGLEGRKPRIDHYTAADWCLPGICAHESALAGGTRVLVPDLRSRDLDGAVATHE